MAATSPDTMKGVPHKLNTAIIHLATLLKHLPQNLPLDPPESTYEFGLDDNDIKEEGLGYAFNHRMEIAFETHRNPNNQIIKLKERGSRYSAMISLLHSMAKKMTDTDRDFYVMRWVQRLTESANVAGAKIPNKRRAVSPPTPNLSSGPVVLNPMVKNNITTFFQTKNTETDQDSTRKIVPVAAQQKPEPIQTQKPCHIISLVSDDEHENLKVQLIGTNMGTTLVSSESTKRPRLEGKDKTQSLSDTEQKSGPDRKRQRTLFDFGAWQSTMQEVLETQKGITLKYGIDPKVVEEEKAREKAKKMQRKRDLGRERTRKFRERAKAAKPKAKAILLGYDIQPTSANSVQLADIAEISHVGSKWKKNRNGKQNGVRQKAFSRVNWYHPFLWAHINRMAPTVGWSPQLIVKSLQRDFPTLFSSLHRGTVAKWISKNNKHRWSTATKNNVERRHSLAASGKTGVLTPYPDLVQEIKKKFDEYRQSGIPIDCLLARSVILAVIHERKPELLIKFKCSEFYVRQFILSVMDWTLRRGTRAAAHVPSNALELCERALFRIVHLINFYDIPPELVINMDQTGVMILMAYNKTYAKKGAKQIDIAARDEKRAYTLCVATTPTGNILPFQQIWSGKTQASLPSAHALGIDEAKEYGFHFGTADSKKKTSHFSTLKTMKEWMTEILKPYVCSQIEQLNLPKDQKAILFIDCYPVHISQEFRAYVAKEFPEIFLLFVPANCTGIFQPADVGLNRICKHFLRQQALEFLVKSHSQQIKNGLTASHVKFTTSLPVLRDASVKPIVNLFNFLSGSSGRDIIRKAWEMSKVYDLNLGAECLTSKKTKALYREYLRCDEILRKEIEGKLGLDSFANVAESLVDETNTEENEPEPEDDASELPLGFIIQNELGIDIGHPTERFCVPSEAVTNVEGAFQPAGPMENIWAYRDDGSLWNKLLD